MKEGIYLNNDIVIINYDQAYPATMADLVGSEEFPDQIRHRRIQREEVKT